MGAVCMRDDCGCESDSSDDEFERHPSCEVIGYPVKSQELPTPRNFHSPQARHSSYALGSSWPVLMESRPPISNDAGADPKVAYPIVLRRASGASTPRSRQSYSPSTPYVISVSARTSQPVQARPFTALGTLEPLASFVTPHTISATTPISLAVGTQQSTKLDTLDPLASFGSSRVVHASRLQPSQQAPSRQIKSDASPHEMQTSPKDASGRSVDARAADQERRSEDTKELDSRMSVEVKEVDSRISIDKSITPRKLTTAAELIAHGRFLKTCLSDDGHEALRVSTNPPELLGNVGIRDWLLPSNRSESTNHYK
eukprot:GEMP01037079.1.p1 GENE.GEMP01037079.1~~GEMP01037079.1.p1  ORF type:complete len:314 (+),score=54.84 GEMP01037079.1:81-1022(+)